MLIESLKYVTNNLRMVLGFSLFGVLVILPTLATMFAIVSLAENGVNSFSMILLIVSLIAVVLMMLFLQGYVIKLIRSRSSGDDRAPALRSGSRSGLKVMLKDGFSLTVISTVYTIVPIVLFSLLFLSIYPISSFIEYGTALAAAGESDIALLTEQMVPAILSFIGIILLLTLYGYYIVPAPILAYANSRELVTAFSVSEITSLLFDRTYFIGFLYVLLAIFLITVIASIVAIIPLIGWLISIPVSVIGTLTVWSIWGRVYRDIYPPSES
ncbi:DUF4013 domain-containing protein [Candidatus Hikarchaeum yamanae]|uniref:DUF4013 domain-containing protein n=1 Tax=Candidatus Hikarchaeum yamanae TaxID=2675326 RepID=UPI0039E98E4F